MSTRMLNSVHCRQSRQKAPVYTSDKRAKFNQRENKKWIRLATVFGYLISVSSPAACLSIYYIFFWQSNYLDNFPVNSTFTALGEHHIDGKPVGQPAEEPAAGQCQPCACAARGEGEERERLLRSANGRVT